MDPAFLVELTAAANGMEHKKEHEAIYVAQEDSHIVMSEKVGTCLAFFEPLISRKM